MANKRCGPWRRLCARPPQPPSRARSTNSISRPASGCSLPPANPDCPSCCCGRRERSRPASRQHAGASARSRPRATASAWSSAGAGICGSNAAAMAGPGNGSWSSIMARIVSVWFPRWPILRLLTSEARCGSLDPQRPLVLAAEASGGPRIAALNAAAEAQGLATGDTLADARAKTTGLLQVRPVDPAADQAALQRLALWATRYTPAVSPWGEENQTDGFFLDVAGAAHLFGGEARLLADLAQRLDRFGLPARLAIADTPGAAWALARFHRGGAIALPCGAETAALAPLPIEALRLSSDTCTSLRKLGFKRVGALIDQPRAPFAARFERELLERLDQALGRASEPLAFIVAPPIYHSLRYLFEPAITQAAVVAIATRLMRNLAHALV